MSFPQQDANNQLNQRIAALSPQQRLLLEQLKRKQVTATNLSIQPRSTDEKLPLSLAQERLWFLHQIDPENPAYNIAIAWELQGNLNISILLKSLQAIIQRHETLRTAFVSDSGKAYQEIISVIHLSLPVIDLQSLSKKQQEDTAKKIALQEASQPFDLQQAPLLRVKLIRLATDKFTLLLTLHHIIADGWSRGILMRELVKNYQAFIAKQKLSLPELSIQYGDFVLWQQKWLQGEEMKMQLAYWEQQLADLPKLELPTDYPRKPIQMYKGATVSELFPRSLLEDLKILSQKQGVTLFMLLLAAFKVLLHRYCHQDDIVLGVPSANRNRSEIEALIGFFVNTLALRTDLSGNPSFEVFLQRVKTTAAGAFRHQDIPFAKVVEALQPERDLSHNPLVQVMFQVQNEAYQLQNDFSLELELPGLQIQQSWVDTGATKFDLSCHLVERSGGLLVAVEYCTDLFEQQTIIRMIQHLRVLLEAIVVNPQQYLSELPILTERERQQILVEWNQTRVDYPKKWVHQIFEAIVEQTPENIAVICGQQTFTYGELNNRANQLAHYLIRLGITKESLVGIYLERSPELIVALLGVLKAGGAYIPIDVKLPQDRIIYMLRDAQPSLILTTNNLQTHLPEYPGQVLCLEQDLEQDWSAIIANPVNLVSGNNLAYVIYTSGSTGKPKGTMLTHKGFANYLNWAINTYPVTQGTGTAVQSSISFDATITSLYTPLLVGQAVVLLPEAEEIEALSNALNSSTNFSLLKLTPAHLTILSQILPQQSLVGHPKALIIGGEALTQQHLEFWHTYSPQTKLINEYGPTETVVGCCIYDATVNATKKTTINSQKTSSSNIPIGRPIANTQLYILDRYLQPVPIGVPGELYIGGDGVARGYLNRPELTAEKFIPNPFSPSPLRRDTINRVSTHSKLYKTGDCARYLGDGTIEYLGRLDNQVKIRGFRVELGEISAALETHPQVKAAIVILRNDIPNHSRLVAYVVAEVVDEVVAGVVTNKESLDLRSYLATKLPIYMLPSAFIWLDNLPLTSNGKIDLKKLPTPDIHQNQNQNHNQNQNQNQNQPRTPTEEILIQIWTELLGCDVGINDNFFERGGDSILSIQMVAKANQAGIKLTPKLLFQHQTIAELAGIIQVNPWESVEQGVISGKVTLTPIQHWLFEQNLHNLHHYNQGVFLEVEPNLQINSLKQAIEKLLQHHDILRARFFLEEGKWQQDIRESIDVYPDIYLDTHPLTVVDLAELPENQQKKFMESTASQPQSSLDLTKGELMRVVLFQLGNNQSHRLLIIIHHLIIDGVSWRILLEDLVNAYFHRELPAKTTSFQEWSQKLLDYAQSDKITRELETWLKILPKESPSLPLDLQDFSFSSNKNSLNNNTIASEAQINVHLNVKQTRALLEEVPKAYQTQINDVLLTALVQSFSQWTKQDSLLVDLEGHGREDLFENVNISRTVGWFTSLFPVYLKLNKSLNDNSNLGNNLKYIKEQLRQIPNKGIGYGVLRYLGSEINKCLTLQALPQSAISFNYLGKLDVFDSQSWIHGLAKESLGYSSNPENNRSHVLNITCWIAQEELQFQWRYSRNLHHQGTIEGLAQEFIRRLEALIQHCQLPESGGFTPSDFAGAKLNQQQLDQFITKLKQPKKR
jgi:amino acid adenylation domain-containing protein/non-ribosomal peptide synthase protein (TIGR01720 family)